MLEMPKPKGPPMLVSDRRLCLDAAKASVVESNDPRAAYLLVGEGGSLAVSEADRYGLVVREGVIVLPGVLPGASEPEPSAVEGDAGNAGNAGNAGVEDDG